MYGWNKNNRGFLAVEMTVGLTTLGMLIIGLALTMHGFTKFNSYHLIRQRCVAAAQAQLDSFAATGEPVPDEVFNSLWPKLDISIDESPGQGQWQSIKLVKVTAKGKSFGKDVIISLSRYIADTSQAGKVN